MSQTLFTLVGKIAIDTTEATAAIDDTVDASEDLADSLGAVATKADTAGDKMGSSSKVGAAAVWLGNTLHTLTVKAGQLAVNLVKLGLDYNSNMEQYQKQFEALLQSEEKAKTLTAEIQKLAKVSPLGMEGLAKNAVQLLSAGTELSDIVPVLEMLGNLSLGDTNKMDSIVTAYTQIMNTGKLKAQEINQLINAGVPLVRLLTEYGGEKFADGTWYQEFLNNPQDFVIAADDVHNAMKAATEEGGQYYRYMDNMMDTYSGQLDRLGEEGKETVGKFLNPFNQVLSSKVFPKISELFSSFGTWADENTGSIEVFAEAVGDFAVWAIQGLIDGMKYLVEHGPEIVATIKSIVEAIIPVLQSVGTGLSKLFGTYEDPVKNKGELLTREDFEDPNSIFYKLTPEQKAAALDNEVTQRDPTGKYAHWTEEQKEVARKYAISRASDPWALDEERLTLQEADVFNTINRNERKQFMGDLDNLQEDGILTVEIAEALLSDGAVKDMQDQVNNVLLTAPVTPVLTGLGNFATSLFSWGTSSTPEGSYTIDQGAANENLFKSLNGMDSTEQVVYTDGSHASGLRNVPYDGYISELHLGEAVLPRNEAEAYRSGKSGSASSTGALETALNSLISLTQQLVNNTASGNSVYLDTGVLVGQLTPGIDSKLGTLTSRKERRS